MEEEIASNIDEVMMEGGSHDLNNKGSDIDSVDHIYDIGAMTSQKIGSFSFFQYHQVLYLNQKRQYKMCHNPRNSSLKEVIQPCHLKI